MGKKHKDKNKKKKSIKELEEKRKMLLINGLIDIAVGSSIAIITKIVEIVADMLRN